MNSAIHRTVCASISVAAGDSVQAPTFGVDRRGEKVAEDADRRRRRGDVAEEARMRVEQRVIEQQPRRLLQQRRRRRCRLRAADRSDRAPRAPPTATRRGSPDRAAAARGTPQSDRRADGRARGTSPASIAQWQPRRVPDRRSSAESLRTVRFPGAAAVHRAEDAVERLPSPQRFAMLGRQILQPLVGGHLRLVARDGPPHRRPRRCACRSPS